MVALLRPRINVPVDPHRFPEAKVLAAALDLRWEAVVDEALALWISAAEGRTDVRVNGTGTEGRGKGKGSS